MPEAKLHTKDVSLPILSFGAMLGVIKTLKSRLTVLYWVQFYFIWSDVIRVIHTVKINAGWDPQACVLRNEEPTDFAPACSWELPSCTQLWKRDMSPTGQGRHQDTQEPGFGLFSSTDLGGSPGPYRFSLGRGTQNKIK